MGPGRESAHHGGIEARWTKVARGSPARAENPWERENRRNAAAEGEGAALGRGRTSSGLSWLGHGALFKVSSFLYMRNEGMKAENGASIPAFSIWHEEEEKMKKLLAVLFAVMMVFSAASALAEGTLRVGMECGYAP